MKHFLNKLASSVMRRQPSLHPFAESIYAARASVDRSAHGSHFVVGIERPQSLRSQPVPVDSRSVLPSRDDSRGVHAWPSEPDLSSPYRPLLPMRETQESPTDDAFAALRRRKEGARSDLESTAESMRGEERITSSLASDPVDGPAVREWQLARQVRPMIPQVDAQAFIAARRSAASAAQFGARQHQEACGADDIQINIGRIEVVAVPPASPRSAPAPTRKGMSLDEYLSRRNGRVG
jgi:hypothetical protein